MSKTVALLKAGGGKSADNSGLELAARRLDIEVEVLLAIDEVESKGRAFDDKGRLIILTEKHVFWRELSKALRGKASRMGLATPKWSRNNYKGLGGAGSDKRWDRLDQMAGLDETAALKSVSYGAYQIMGFNHGLCGYASVQDFVVAFAQSEEIQQEGFIVFLKKVGLLQALREKDFQQIARRYNGSGQVSYYAGHMQAAYNRLIAARGKVRTISDTKTELRLGSKGRKVSALQERLVELGYHLKVDGDFGPATRRQVVAFQVDHGLAAEGIVDPQTVEALETALPINLQPGGTRENLTVKDLRQAGSKTIRQADNLTLIGVGAASIGGVAETVRGLEGVAGLEALKGFSGLIQDIAGLVAPVLGLISDNKWLALIAIGGAVFFIARQIKLRRLHDAKEWRHVG
ncbi:N-acetylmuramidase domain-containing protein [Roseibium sediminis]|uniref:N-acetylmuramidase domain-containing protein n=1 Tax=Roseibium sediminis TaxID=1775174 RepID=UPI00123D0793|nr:N-acetylmuramidase domain-containing protein [Roseibium sediminis]